MFEAQGLLLVVRRYDEDHLVILGLGSVSAQMTDEASLRPEGSLALWTGNGGSCRTPVGTVLSGLSGPLSCSSPVRLVGLCSLVNSCSPTVSVLSCLSAPRSYGWCWRPSGNPLKCPWSAFSGGLESAYLLAARQRAAFLLADGLACELHDLPSGAVTASEWWRC